MWRAALARPTAWVVGGLLALASLAVVTIAAILFYISSENGLLAVGAIYGAFPLAIALTLLRRRPPFASPRVVAVASPVRRRLRFAVAACVVVAASTAAYQWGAQPVRNLVVARIDLVGMKAAAKGDHEEALRQYDRALTVDPDNVGALSQRARSNEKLQRYDRALADLDHALGVQPKNVTLLLQRAGVYDLSHAIPSGLADLDRALALSPDNPGIWSFRGELKADSGDVANANADIDHGRSLNPRFAAVLRAQSDLLARAGDYEGARHILDEDLRLNPGDFDAMFDRGRLRLYQRDFAGAAQDLGLANPVLDPPYVSIWLFLARKRMGIDGSVDLAAKTQPWPTDAWPHPVILQLLGKMSAAQTRDAAVNDDQRCEADFYNGELLLDAGDNDPAIAAFKLALGECPLGFFERIGAAAELGALDHQTANGEVKLNAPAAAAPATPAAADASPGTAAPASGVVAAPAQERQIATGAAPASIVDGGVYKSGNAVWSLIDRGNGVAELDAVLLFSDPSIHGELVLKRTLSNGDPHYDLLFRTLASDRNTPPFSKLGVELATPEILAYGKREPLTDPTAFLRVDGTTYQMPVSPGNVANGLVRLAAGTKLTVQLAPNCQCLSLSFDLNAHSAPVFVAAETAWR